MKYDDSWNYLFKMDYTYKDLCVTNLLYTPRLNPEKTIMCMIYDETQEYQKKNKGIGKKLIDFFFERELKFLKIFQGKGWCPKLLHVNYDDREIYIEFNKETFNNPILIDDRDLDKECPDWEEQVFSMLKEIDSLGYYKLALYPHCFFLDDNKKIKTIDFYSVIEKDNCKLDRSVIEGMIGRESTDRFNQATSDGMVDFSVFFKQTMMKHLDTRWHRNPFPEFYKKLIE